MDSSRRQQRPGGGLSHSGAPPRLPAVGEVNTEVDGTVALSGCDTKFQAVEKVAFQGLGPCALGGSSRVHRIGKGRAGWGLKTCPSLSP